MSLFENTIICRRCGYVRLCFDGTVGYNGKLVPKEYRTGLIHQCEISESFPCIRECGEILYYDRRVLLASGKRIALNQTDGKYHNCKGRSDSIEC